jgi:hypothetical protein
MVLLIGRILQRPAQMARSEELVSNGLQVIFHAYSNACRHSRPATKGLVQGLKSNLRRTAQIPNALYCKS